MQILKLDFAGMGPFPGRHVIDFTRFADTGLFLIDGPTGAGKTTIIDAIVFALYGQPAGGDDSSRDRIVSTFLHSQALTAVPYVDLTIDTSVGLLRVRRTPEFERPKKRGAGVTIEHSSIQLWRLASLDDPGVLLSSRHGEAEDQLKAAVGLDRAQFTQTVVLPQGQFAAFLRATPENRAQVLQDIFGTKYYERLRDQLKALASARRAATEQARNDFGQATDVFLSLAWSDGQDDRGDDPAHTQAWAGCHGPDDIRAAITAADGTRVLELADERVRELSARQAAAELAARAARSAQEAAQRSLQQQCQLAERILRRQQLSGRLQELESKEPEMLAGEALLLDADRAHQVADPLRYAAVASQERLVAEQGWREAVTRVAGGPDADLAPADGLHDQPPNGFERLMADEVQRLDRLRGSLTDLVVLEANLPGRRESLAAELESHHLELTAISQARDQLRERQTALTALEAEHATAVLAADARAEALLALTAAEQVAQAAAKASELGVRLAQARSVELCLDEEWSAKRRRAQQARADWLDNVAGVLAEELVPQQPCPVCGGVDHPVPARRRSQATTQEELQRLESQADLAREELARAKEQTGRLAEVLTEQQTRCDGLDPACADERVTAARQQLQVALDAGERATQLQEQAREMRAADELAQEKLTERDRQAAAVAAELKARHDNLEADTARVAFGCQGYRTVSERSAALRDRAELAEALARAATALTLALQTEQQRADELADALARRGFDSVDQVCAAALDDDQRESLRERLHEHRVGLAGVRAQLAEPVLAGLEEATLPDLAAAESAERQAEACQRSATQELARAEHLLQAASGANDQLSTALANVTQTIEGARPYLRLCELACGGEGNEKRIALPTFVLMRRFEELVDIANTRLHAMTLGRYSLARSEEREGRAHKRGLGLQVIDHSCNDAQRDPKTLSGGETFLTSLALALGLADAVTAEAGGIRLDTLFIDEGFGTLDPGTLDLVMAQLAELQHEGGRTVGVISHVGDLQQRIADQIVVAKGPDGTSQISSTVDGAVSRGCDLTPAGLG